MYRTVAVASGQRIFVLGGHNTAGDTIDTVDELNPLTGAARIAGTLAVPTHGAAAAAVGHRLLVYGGASTAVHDLVQQFDPSRRHALVIGRLPAPRADVTAALAGRTVVLVGGFDGTGPQRTVWASSDRRHFRAITALPQAVRYPAVIADRNDVYVFGGLISGGEYDGRFSDLIQRVRLGRHPSATVVGRLPTPLAHAMGALVAGRLLVLGGSTPNGPTAEIERFDPILGRVSPAGRLPRPLTDGAVATLDNTTYLLGGISTRPVASVTEIRLIPADRPSAATPHQAALSQHYIDRNVAVRYPSGWRVHRQPLTQLVSPRQLLAISSFAIRQQHPDPNCTPQTARRELPPTGVLLFLLEQVPPDKPTSARAFFHRRPRRFELEDVVPQNLECFGLSREIAFRAHGRNIYLLAYLGPKASKRTVHLADTTLDSLSLP